MSDIPKKHPQSMSIAEGRPLTNLQQRFVAEILADASSATKAAIRAGYSIKSAENQACLLLKDPRVMKFLQEARDKATDALGLSAERVLQELWKIAGANPGDQIIVSDDGSLDLQVGPGEVAVTNIDSNGKKAKSVTTKTVKPADKVAALTQMAKIMNLFPTQESKAEVKVTLSLTELIEKSMESKENPDGTLEEIELETEAA